ncbi:hypothetical protein Hanom_Chr08g00715831 [Helianthus anomalus]
MVSLTFHQNYNFKKPFLYLARELVGCKFTLCPVYCDCSTRVQICMVAQPERFAFGLYQLWVVGYLVYDASLCLLKT